MESGKSKKRIEWVDCARGFAALCVMFGHTIEPEWITYWIYSFHIPLFFFLSGYVYNAERSGSFVEYLCKQAKNVLLPAYTLTLLYIAKAFVYDYLLMDNIGKEWLYNAFKGLFLQRFDNSAFWFFPCLFVAELLLWGIFHIGGKKSPVQVWILSCAAMLAGFLYTKYVGYPLPWFADTAFVATGFLGTGYLFRQKPELLEKLTGKWGVLLFGILNIVMLSLQKFYFKYDRIDMVTNRYNSFVLFCLCAICGILAVIGVLRRCPTSRILRYCGQNSAVFYCVASMTSFIASVVVFHFGHFDKTTASAWMLMAVAIFYVAVESVFCVAIAEFMNRYCPFLLGRKAHSEKQHS